MGGTRLASRMGVPGRFYVVGYKDERPVLGSQEQAEAAFREWLEGDDCPEYVDKAACLGMLDVTKERVTEPVVTHSEAPSDAKACNTCNKPFDNRGELCNACRQRAYRGRRGG